MALGDLDGDDDLDAFIGSLHGNKVWLNDGAGHFTNTGQSMDSLLADGVALGDLDGDGDLDAFVVNSFSNPPNKVWLNDGTGVFTDSGQSLGSLDTVAVTLGDLDGDGDLDAFVGNGGAAVQPNKVWLNQNGLVTTYEYDNANRLTDRVVSDGRVYSYTWSARGQMLAEWTQGYPVRTFTYDGAGQMVEATVFTLTTRFTYNGLGARVAVEVVGLAPKGLRPEGQGATTYKLDYAAGNRILAETQ